MNVEDRYRASSITGLSCLDFFFWGTLKTIVYETTVDTDTDIVERTSVGAANISEIPGIFERIRQMAAAKSA